jgi:hypothetical protein
MNRNHDRHRLHSATIEPLEQRQLYTAVQFGTPTPYATGGTYVYDMGVGDFNHDGKQDVAVISKANGVSKLEWRPGDGTGKLGAPVSLPISQSYVEELAVGDFNGDGLDDLAVGGTGITMYLNNGSGLVQGKTTTVQDSVVSITAIYAHNSNREDIAIGNFPNGVSLYSLDGNDQPLGNVGLFGGGYAIALAAGDLNGDNVQDLVAAEKPSNGSVLPGSINVFWGLKDANGKANGNFTFGPTFAAGSVPSHVVVIDINGDKRNDIIATCEGDYASATPGSIHTILNSAGGLGAMAPTYISHPRRIAAANFGSGKVDYVSSDLYAGLQLTPGKGDGTFGVPTNINGVSDPTGVWAINLNGDSKPDLVAKDNVGNLFTILNTTQDGGSIAGNIFNDIDGDGVQDAIEGALPGRTIFIDTDNDKVLDAGEKFTTTDNNGNYLIPGLPAGTYKVRQLQPAGWSQTTPASGYGISVTLATNQSVGGKVFGSRLNGASISGTVINDENGNGTYDAGDNPLASRTVYIDSDNDNVFDAGEKSTSTSAVGAFAFTGLAAGTYKVRQLLPSGWSQTTPASGAGISVTVAANQSVGGKLFGARKTPAGTASIWGKVFNDLDGDGTKDAGEGGLSGRTIWLDLDNDKVIDANEPTTVTDVYGNYAFTGLAAGTYKVRQQLPPAGSRRRRPAATASTSRSPTARWPPESCSANR